jgi:hypothetical protein
MRAWLNGREWESHPSAWGQHQCSFYGPNGERDLGGPLFRTLPPAIEQASVAFPMNHWPVLTLMILAAAPLHAQTLQCGTKLVTKGDISAKVAALCGRPTHIEHSFISRAWTARIAGQVSQGATTMIEIPVEVWIYNLGPDKLMQQIRFEDGKVVNINSLGYGYNEDD